MAINLQEIFERSCRLCAKEQDVTLMIFSVEAEAMLLQKKLNKYLLLEVDEDDKLPKNICIQCCNKLQTVCEFIDTVHNSQDILHIRSIELEKLQSSHSQFNNPCKNSAIESTVEVLPSNDESVTSINTILDPMMILQNCKQQLNPSVEDSCKSEHEDVTHLHGLLGENVTIKLIRKKDRPNHCDEAENKYECKICLNNFPSELSLNEHVWNHNIADINKQDYPCKICKETFTEKNQLIHHMQVHEAGGNCIDCGRNFRSADKLLKHMAVHKFKENSFNCKVCGKYYDTRSNLRAHTVSHSSERPHKCQFCKKTFKKHQDLKFHLNHHTGAKPYKCPFCDKHFASSGSCYSHKSRMHPGHLIQKKKESQIQGENNVTEQMTTPSTTPIKAKHKCPICAHIFLKRDNYTYHMYQHTGEKPFQCLFCSKNFVTRKGLLIHHNNEHPTRNRPLALLSRNLHLM